jgi:hypothetical protein
VLAWREALEAEQIDVAVWSIHRKIQTSGHRSSCGCL